jgi:anti-sigma-K factor RskA
MSLDTQHDEVRALLALEALGALDGEEGEALRAHLEGCPECRAELAGLRDAGATLALSLPAREMDAERSARLRARLLARAAADRGGESAARPVASTPVTPLTQAPSRRRNTGGWLAAAAALLLLVGVGGWGLSQYRRNQALSREFADARLTQQRLRRELAGRDSTLAALGAAGVRVIDLASTREPAPSGRMFWNPGTARWTFFARGLPALRQGREYQLWLITPAGPVSAGTFRPGQDGQALVQATFALDRDSLRAVAVTEEPAGGLPAPSGAPLIVGAYGE